MHWELRQARTFIAVAEALNFSAAARQLNTTQSAVSRTVAQMEADLGVPLLSRTTRKVLLTDEGRLLLEECREVVSHFDRWIKRAQRVAAGTSGLISVGVNDFSIQAEAAHLIGRFSKAFPEINFRFTSATRERQLELLDRGEIDLGFAMGPLAHPEYRTMETATYGLNLLVNRENPLARKASVTLSDLTGQVLILGGPYTWHTFHAFLDRAFDADAVPLVINQDVEESVAIFGLVAAGAGVSLYPDCQDHMTLRNVVKIPVDGLRERIQTVLVWHESYISQAARLFQQFVQREVSAGTQRDPTNT